MKVPKGLFWFHLITGLVAGLFILFMCSTGILLAFRPQIIALADKNITTVKVSSDAKRMSVNDILDTLRDDYPDAKPAAVTIYADPKSSLMISLGKNNPSVYVNPYTGTILGETSKISILLQQVEGFHRWLGSKEIGQAITGTCVILFFFLIISGLYMWLPTKVMALKPELTGKAMNWNLHNTIGFWCAPMLLVTTLTGTIMAHSWATNALYYVTRNKPPVMEKEQAAHPQGMKHEGEHHEGDSHLNVDALLDRAQKQLPGWFAINLRLGKGGMPTVASIQDKNNGGRSQLTLDPKTAEVIKWEPFTSNNLGMKLRFGAKQIHTGQLFGIPNALLMVMGALGGIFLVWTGFAMAWQRFFVRKLT